MASNAQQRMDALRGTTAGVIMAEWLRERLATHTERLLQCTKETFDAQKGRCIEIQDQIKYIEGKGT